MGADSASGSSSRDSGVFGRDFGVGLTDAPTSFSVDSSGGTETTGLSSASGFAGRSSTTGGGTVDNSDVGGVGSLVNQSPSLTQAPQSTSVDNTGQSAAEGAGPLFQPPQGGGQVININPPQQSAQPPGGNNQPVPVTPGGPAAPPSPPAAPPAREQQVRQDQTVGRPKPQRSLLTIGLAETTRKSLLGV